jgi:hypothetical protein
MNPLAVSGLAVINFAAMLIIVKFVLMLIAFKTAATAPGQALGVLVAG